MTDRKTDQYYRQPEKAGPAGAVDVMHHHGVTTGRWRSNGRATHTVYPVKRMVVVGDLAKGFEFYGPFDTFERARTWAVANTNLRSATAYHVYPIFDVRNDA